MFKNRNVCITGGASFIGSHLVESLLQDGAKVTVVDDLSSGTLDNLETALDKIDFKNLDLRDSASLECFKGQHVVFHLANIHGGRGFIETHPAELAQNFLIDGNVFYGCLKHKVDRVIYTSSACAYPTNLQSSDLSKQSRYLSEQMADPFKEGCAQADGEYGWAKFMGEMALMAYHKQFGVKGVSCRLFTVYGPRENESHAIIAFIAKAILKQEPYEVWGTGEQDRNFTYVSDVVTGLKLAAANITDCRSVNIGTSEITKIKDAARIVCDIVGHNPAKFFFDISKPEGVHARAADTSNQIKWLNWEPAVKFKDGIQDTIDWYLAKTDVSALKEDLERRLFER